MQLHYEKAKEEQCPERRDYRSQEEMVKHLGSNRRTNTENCSPAEVYRGESKPQPKEPP